MRNSRATSSRRKKAKNRDSSDLPFLPDDSIEEIVSRLPIKDVLRFKCVSKSAVNLISDPDFIDKHMKRSCVCAPLILVDDYRRPRYFLGKWPESKYLLDKWSESNRKKSKMVKKCHLHPEYRILLSSQDGLIVSTRPGYYNYIFFNPIYSETLELSVSSPINYVMSKEILGVFYRPCVKEYSTLWELKVDGRASTTVQYEMLDLCSQSKWRKIEYPFRQYYRFLLQHDKPRLINGYLYWICQTTEYKYGIMVFDTSIEGFDLIPWPDAAAGAFNTLENNITSLLNGNGVLKLVQILDKEFEYDVNIWALNDHVKKIWSSSQYRMISRIGNNTSSLFVTVEIIALCNEELSLVVEDDDRCHREIFVCNLNLGTTRKFGRLYPHTASFRSHVMSIAPVKNFKLKVAIW